MSEDRWRHVRFYLIGTIAFLGMVTLVLLLYVIFGTASTTQDVRETQITGTPLGKKIERSTDDTAETLALLQDCIDPNGKCGQRSAQHQADALGAIREDMFVIAACIDKPGQQTQAQIRRCWKSHQK